MSHFENALKPIQQKYNLSQFSLSSENVAIIMESRPMPNAEFILRQFSRFLSNDWAVIIFVTKNVFNYYNNICKILNNNIQIKVLDYPLTSLVDYNNIMLNLSFWKSLQMYKKVLTFQFDTMLYLYGIEKYLIYDYIGGPWNPVENASKHVGNGGLSIRTIDAVIHCLEEKDNITIGRYMYYDRHFIEFKGNFPEDIFYAYAMVQLGYNIPSIEIASQFSVDYYMRHVTYSIGSHKLSEHMNIAYIHRLLNSIIPYQINNINTITTNNESNIYFLNKYLKKTFMNNNGIHMISGNLQNNTNINKIHYTYLLHNYFNTKYLEKYLFPTIHNCKGIFVFSKYIKNNLQTIIDNTYTHTNYIDYVDNIYLPSFISSVKHKIYDISNIEHINTQLNVKNTLSSKIIKSDDNNMINKYIDTLKNNKIIIEIMNNIISDVFVDCIYLNIPFFVNRCESVEEYIGKDYPLFYSDENELNNKIQNIELIKAAYNYLYNNDIKNKLSYDYFIQSILNSKITVNILTQKL